MDEALKIHSRDPRSSRPGYIFVILAAVLWAISGSASKFLFQSGLSPFQLVQLRTTLAVSTLFIWLLIRQPGLLKISRKDLMFFILLGISLASAQFTYLYAISKLQVAAAVTAYFFLNEIMGPWQITGAVLVITSIALLQLRQGPS